LNRAENNCEETRISTAMEGPSTENSEKDRCKEHGLDIKLFCETCKKCICIGCIDAGIHPWHSFSSLADIVQEHVATIKQYDEIIDRKLQEIHNLQNEIRTKIGGCNLNYNQKLDQLKRIRDSRLAEVEYQYQNSLKDLLNTDTVNVEKLKTKLTELEPLEKELSSFKKFNETLLGGPRSELINSQQSLTDNINSLNWVRIPANVDVQLYDR
jgi:predicted nuclease with TOPRIM domain